LNCQHCGAEVIFDSELQAYVCPCCGTVLDDRPLIGYDDVKPCHHVGSYVVLGNPIGRRHLDLVYLERYGRGWGRTRAENARRLVKLLLSTCRSLGLDPSVCIDAEKILFNNIGNLQKLSRVRSRQLVGEALLKVAWSRGIPLQVQRVEELLGVSLFSVTEYIDKVAKIKYYETSMSTVFARVAEAVLKVSPSLGDKLISIARDAMSNVLSGSYKYRALAAFYYAARVLNVKLNMSAVCRELGLSENCAYNARVLALRYLFKP
jgi:transcription initiation factor TFIIIB Brf1 subunit/transcription initiation factor TFIIB